MWKNDREHQTVTVIRDDDSEITLRLSASQDLEGFGGFEVESGPLTWDQLSKDEQWYARREFESAVRAEERGRPLHARSDDDGADRAYDAARDEQ